MSAHKKVIHFLASIGAADDIGRLSSAQFLIRTDDVPVLLHKTSFRYTRQQIPLVCKIMSSVWSALSLPIDADVCSVNIFIGLDVWHYTFLHTLSQLFLFLAEFVIAWWHILTQALQISVMFFWLLTVHFIYYSLQMSWAFSFFFLCFWHSQLLPVNQKCNYHTAGTNPLLLNDARRLTCLN